MCGKSCRRSAAVGALKQLSIFYQTEWECSSTYSLLVAVQFLKAVHYRLSWCDKVVSQLLDRCLQHASVIVEFDVLLRPVCAGWEDCSDAVMVWARPAKTCHANNDMDIVVLCRPCAVDCEFTEFTFFRIAHLCFSFCCIAAHLTLLMLWMHCGTLSLREWAIVQMPTQQYFLRRTQNAVMHERFVEFIDQICLPLYRNSNDPWEGKTHINLHDIHGYKT